MEHRRYVRAVRPSERHQPDRLQRLGRYVDCGQTNSNTAGTPMFRHQETTYYHGNPHYNYPVKRKAHYDYNDNHLPFHISHQYNDFQNMSRDGYNTNTRYNTNTGYNSYQEQAPVSDLPMDMFHNVAANLFGEILQNVHGMENSCHGNPSYFSEYQNQQYQSGPVRQPQIRRKKQQQHAPYQKRAVRNRPQMNSGLNVQGAVGQLRKMANAPENLRKSLFII